MNEYRAWIPTNNGILSKELVAESYPPSHYQTVDNILTLTQDDTFEYSDSIFKEKQQELSASYILKIDFNSLPWTFNLDAKVDRDETIHSSGVINENGLIEFSVKTKNLNGNDENIRNTVFTMVKNCVHGNSHHDQKVDTIRNL